MNFLHPLLIFLVVLFLFGTVMAWRSYKKPSFGRVPVVQVRTELSGNVIAETQSSEEVRMEDPVRSLTQRFNLLDERLKAKRDRAEVSLASAAAAVKSFKKCANPANGRTRLAMKSYREEDFEIEGDLQE